ncbi:MAG TPA: AbrB/MazE/SpoVT family DNA-binding domain-containing protein [Candidatus Nanoarchaeia archaeon]|nr:AbrB/MazE/SpoVT family DNA-binding domain-containing protein [Candidatus Nanoarchaeia archaeon]
MKTVSADERGRITLGSDMLDRYGKKFIVIAAEKEIVLVPIAEDPLGELKKIGKSAGIDSFTFKELKRMAKEEASKEALSG